MRRLDLLMETVPASIPMLTLRKQISLVLALVIVITAVLNAVFVTCIVDAGHHEIELIGHRLAAADGARDAEGATGHGSDANLHSDGCADLPLIAAAATRGNADPDPYPDVDRQLAALPPTAEAWNRPRIALSEPRHGLPAEPMRRPAIDDLSTVRLLI